MLKFIHLLFFVTLVFCISGCSTLFGKHNFVTQRETEYMRSTATPPLQLPPSVSTTSVGDDYIIPGTTASAPTQPVSLLPPGSLTEQIARGKVSSAVLKQKFEPTINTNSTTNTATSNTSTPVLPLDQNKDQLWNKIGTSLNKAGYLLVNQNQKAGIYYLLDTPSTGGKVKMNTPIYQLHIQNINGVAQAYLTDDEGKPLTSDVAQLILDDLRDALAGKTPSPVKRFLKQLF